MTSIDLVALREAACEAEAREAFRTLERRRSGRLGVGVRLGNRARPRYFVEVVLDPSPERPEAQPGRLAKIEKLMRYLRSRGYELRVEDDGCVTAERRLDARWIHREVDLIRGEFEGV